MTLDPDFASNKLADLLMDHATAGIVIVPHGAYSSQQFGIVEIWRDKTRNKIFISVEPAKENPTSG